MIDLARLQQWTEDLQRLPDGPLEQAAQTLGLTGSLVARSDRIAAVTPLPEGVHELDLVRNEHGLTRIDLELEQGFSCEDLDRVLGTGINGPRVGPHSPHQRRYLRSRPDLPSYCVVYAEFTDQELQPGSVSTTLTVMRERREP